MVRLLVYARPELTDRPPGATGGLSAPGAAGDLSASAFLLLEGSWPEDPPPAAYCSLSSARFGWSDLGWPGSSASEPPEIRGSGGSLRSTPATRSQDLELLSLDDAIDGHFDWIDQQATDLAELLGGADPLLSDRAGPPDRISPAFLNALALRYYLVKLIRPLAYLTEVQPLRPGDHLELVAAAGRDADYAEVLSQFCRAAGVHYRVRWVEGSTPPAGSFPANRLWRRCLARLSGYFQPPLEPALAAKQPVAPRVVLCGNPRLLDPVCRELLARGCRLWWLCDRFAVRLSLRWRAAGVRQLTCNASLGRDGEKGTGTFCAQHPSGRSGKRFLSPFRLECRGVNLAGPVHRWLAERLATCGPHQTRLVEQIDAGFRRVRPDALVLDEDATPLARAAVAVGRRYGAGSFVVQHGVPYCRFGFSPPVADRVLVWGESSRQRLIEWGVPAEQIRLTGSPQHDDLCQELQRLHYGALLMGRRGRPQCATASSEAVPGVELIPKPLTPGPSPRKRGEGRTFWDRLVTRLHGLAGGKLWHTEEIGRTRILLLTTVPPRDDRPDAVALHLTGRTYARMLRTAFAAVAGIDGAELVVKLHPRSGDDPTVRALQAEFRSLRTRMIRRGRLEEWLAGVSCVLSCGSSAGVEATLAGVPVIELAPPGASGFLPHEPWGLAGTARNEAELRELLAQLAADGWRARPGPEPNVFGGLDRPAAARIADEVLAPRAQSDRTTTHTRRATRAETDRQALPAGYC